MRSGVRQGFTLVEIVVVLLLLGIAASIIVPRLDPDPRRVLAREATRLCGALEQAVATAQWRGDMLGISLDGRAYRFWRRDADGQWQVLAGDDVLAPRALPAGIDARPETYADAPVAPNAILPFRPSGRNAPYTLRLAAREWTAHIVADPLNRVAWTLSPGSP